MNDFVFKSGMIFQKRNSSTTLRLHKKHVEDFWSYQIYSIEAGCWVLAEDLMSERMLQKFYVLVSDGGECSEF